jgi:hypothetical protein
LLISITIDGSSLEIRLIISASFSSSDSLKAFIAVRNFDVENFIAGYDQSASFSERVSQFLQSFNFTTAAISPADTSEIFVLFLPAIA